MCLWIRLNTVVGAQSIHCVSTCQQRLSLSSNPIVKNWN